MSEVDCGSSDSPKISLSQVSVHPANVKGSWSIVWRVENLNQDSLRLNTAQFPHGQFKAGEQRFQPPIVVEPGESTRFEVTVACPELAGTVVENAFVIFSAIWLDSPWRIFARLRVVVDAEGKPMTLTESITTQQVGFSTEFQSDS
jgi:hypothetical protein